MCDYASNDVQYEKILGAGGEGLVVSAIIDGRSYALKIVRNKLYLFHWIQLLINLSF